MSRKQVIILIIYISLLLMPALFNFSFSISDMFSHSSSKSNISVPSFPSTLRQLKQWPSKIDDYTVKSFPGRRELIHIISRELKSYNMSISSKVVFGDNDMLFYKGESDVIDEHRSIRVLSDNQLDIWLKNYLQRKQIIENYDSKLFFFIIPDKHSIYPEYMPDYLSVIDRPRIAEQLHKLFNENDIDGFLYLQDCLMKHLNDIKLYHRYDTHWTDQGAYIGYLEIMKMIDPEQQLNWIMPDQVQFIPIKQKGDLAGMLSIPEMIEDTIAVNFSPDVPLVTSDKEKVNYWQNEYVCEAMGQQKVALFICDSFLEAVLGKYLERTFGKSIFIRHTANKDMELFRKYKPDFVIYCYVERLIPYQIKPFTQIEFK